MTNPKLTGFAPEIRFAESTVNTAPQILDAEVTFTDPDNNFDGGSLTLSGLLAEDTVSVRDEGMAAGQIGLSGTNVTFGGTVVGTLAGGAGTDLTISFNATATSASIDALIQNLTYANSSDSPSASRDLVLNVIDATGADLGLTEPKFVPLAGTADPFDGINFGVTFTTPSFVDLDGDGDLDAVVGNAGGTLQVFDNNDANNGFTELTGIANPFDGFVVGTQSAPSFVDVDGDGDLDAVVGSSYGTLQVYDNNDANNGFTEVSASDNPLRFTYAGTYTTPSFVDVDGDGDLDAVIGERFGSLRVFDSYSFILTGIIELTGTANPLDGINVSGASAPSFVDLDSDGDLDLVVGSFNGTLQVYDNNDANNGFTKLTGIANPFNGIDVGTESAPSFVDVDGDGDLDAVVGSQGGTLVSFENTIQPVGTITVNVTAETNLPTDITVLEDVVSNVDLSVVTLPYLDADGILTLTLTASAGQLNANLGSNDIGVTSTGSGTNTLVLQGSASDIEAFLDVGSAITYLGVKNANGEDAATISLIGNDGTGDVPLGTVNLDITPLSELPTLRRFNEAVTFTESAVNGAPQFLDADVTFNDPEGDFDGGTLTLSGVLAEDTVSVNNQGDGAGQIGVTGSSISYGGVSIGSLQGGVGSDLTITFLPAATTASIDALIQNLTYANSSDTPTPSRDFVLNVTDADGGQINQPQDGFVELTGAANPFDGFFVGINKPSPAFVDLDGDGDLDLVVGQNSGHLSLFDNADGIFTPVTGPANPFDGIVGVNTPVVGINTTPTFVDLDGDGDLDLVVGGDFSGGLKVFDNNDADDGFTQLTGTANPFNDIDVGFRSKPSFVDLDGDGDLDAVVGNADGTLQVFDNNDATNGFTALTGIANPFDGIDVGSFSSPDFVDLDGDGDLDLVVGNSDGTIRVYGNADGVFTPITGPANPFEDVNVNDGSKPTFADLDGDGDLDAVLSGLFSSDPVLLFENNGRNATINVSVIAENDPTTVSGLPSDITVFEDLASNLDLSAFELKDGDSDGTFTLSLSVSAGTMMATDRGDVTVTGSGTDSLVFTGSAGDIDALLNSAGTIQYTGPADVNGDNVATITLTANANDGVGEVPLGMVNLDISEVNDAPVLSGVDRQVTFLEDVVNATPQLLDVDATVTDLEQNFDGGTLNLSGLLAEDIVSLNNQGTGAGEIGLSGTDVTFGGVSIGTLAGGVGEALVITFNDLADSTSVSAAIQNLTFANSSDAPTENRDLVLNVIDADGANANFGSSNFSQIFGGTLPLDGGGTNASPTFVDLDGDGDLDLITGNRDGTLSVFDNTSENYTQLTGADNPFNSIDVSTNAAAAFVDLDGDGDLDVVVGNTSGTLRVFDNNDADTDFTELTGTDNPFDGINVGFYSKPTFVDLDGDDDLDLVVGTVLLTDHDPDIGQLSVYDNNDADAGFTELTGVNNPLDGIDVGSDPAPSFVDLNNDGQLDLVVGDIQGTLQAFVRNDSGSGFTELTDALDPFDGVDFGGRSAPTFVDLDGDGDLDAVIGVSDGTLQTLENTPPRGEVITVSITPENEATIITGVPSDVTALEDTPTDLNLSAITLVDGDEDGFSLVLTASAGTIAAPSALYFLGVGITGSGTSELTLLGTAEAIDGLLNNETGIQYTGASNANGAAAATITLTSNDGSGTTDLGEINVNISAVNDAPTLTNFTRELTFTESTVNAAPQLLDFDVSFEDQEDNFDGGTLSLSGLLAGDSVSVNNQGSGAGQISLSDTDVLFGGVVIGMMAGGVGETLTVTFNDQATSASIDALIENLTYANNSDAPTPSRDLLLNVTDAAGADMIADVQSFNELTDAAFPFDSSFGSNIAPSFVDLDGDGDLDLVVGDLNGRMLSFDNNDGDAGFSRLFGADNPLSDIDVGSIAKPTFVDLDSDGDLDMVVGSANGTLRVFDNNDGDAGFSQLTGIDNPLDDVSVIDLSAPTFVDLDSDGDLDLVIGAGDGSLSVFDNNDGDAGFTQLAGADNPFDGIENNGEFTFFNEQSAPAFVDIDGDGDLDLVVGTSLNGVRVFDNNDADDGFIELFGADNPLSDIDVGSTAKPTFVDLDGDNDFDLVTGSLDGSLSVFENTTALSQIVTVNVTAENEIFDGTAANDRLIGTATADSITGFAGNDLIRGGAGTDILDGGDGNDLLDYRGSSEGVSVNLATNTATGGDATGDTISGFERVFGSSYNDVLTGDAGNNLVRGGAGADIMDGGNGNDMLDYRGSSEGVSVNLATNIATGGDATGDTISGFERVFGSSYNDVLTGDAGNNLFLGGAGADIMDGGAGTDVLDYRTSTAGISVNLATSIVTGGDATGDTISGFERVFGSSFNDELTGDDENNALFGLGGADRLAGGDGNDLIRGGAGADIMDGGAGNDSLDYRGSLEGVSINLATNTATGGDATGDTISGFERVLGSSHNDDLTGDDGNNLVRGDAGADTIDGGDGYDIAQYVGASTDYNVVYIGNDQWTVEDVASGDLDTISNIETLRFDDVDISLPQVVAYGDEDTEITGQLTTVAIGGDPLAFAFSLQTDPSHGSVTVNGDGTFSYSGDPDYAGLDTFSYAVENADGVIVFEDVTVSVSAVADTPLISVLALAGDSVNEIRLVVSANQIDLDGSEFIDQIVASGVPVGATLAPGLIDPGDEPLLIVQEFILTLPADEDSNFDLTFTTKSIEGLNGNEAENFTTIPIVYEHAAATTAATFLAAEQSIWNTGDEFSFVSDEYIGIDSGAFDRSITEGPFSAGLNGQISLGLQSTLTLEGGHIDAEAIYDVTVETRYNVTTDQLIVDTSELLTGANFATVGPSGTYTLDFLYDIFLEAYAAIDVDLGSINAGPAGEFELGSITEEIGYSVNVPNGITNLVDLNSSDDLETSVDFPDPLGAFSVNFDWPDIATAGSNPDDPADPDTAISPVTGSGASNNFLELVLDMDELLFQLLGTPFNPLDPPKIDGPPDDPIYFADLDLLDLDLVGGVNFLQEFEMQLGGLTGQLIFEDESIQNISIGSTIEINNASDIDAGGNENGLVEFEFVLSPTSVLSNNTDLGYNIGVDVSVFSGELGYELDIDVPNIGTVTPTDSFEFDPLFTLEPSLPVAADDVYDQTFALEFATESFDFVV